ncbi:hypothetical protein [Calycomorphotria hydatis]|uniref:Immunoglobulin G-binding protein A n=1 Tax=Calycomorphotria hydatis TaxID=2528027 RepID=A0A517T9J8_9PLAN|nr:hypothetical protein [Calycomorphotria hydatis]QDT65029.1 hypothetical protein V22_22750 [Calycomorphotria hydatis]
MSTAVEQKKQPRYVDYREYVDFQLQKARSGIRWTDILTSLAAIALAVVCYVMFFALLDHWIVPGGLTRFQRIIMLSVMVVLAGAWLAWRVVMPYLRRINPLYAAQQLEATTDVVDGTLLNLIDAERSATPPAASVVAALQKRAAKGLSKIDLDEAIDRRTLMRLAYALLAAVVIACLYAVLSPKSIGNSIQRALLPAADVPVATRVEITRVDPGDTTVVAGSQVSISVELSGEVPESVFVSITTDDQQRIDDRLDLEQIDPLARRWERTLTGPGGRGLQGGLEYTIHADDAIAGPYRIDVVPPPSATISELSYDYPEYMLFPDAVRAGPDIDAFEGTHLTLKATANVPLQSAKIVFADEPSFVSPAEEMLLAISDGVNLQGDWTLALRSDGSAPKFFRIECRSELGHTNPSPPVHEITIRPDQWPEITIFDPKGDLERPANAVVPLFWSATDPDFGVRDVLLRMEKNGSEIPQTIPLYEGRSKLVSRQQRFELDPLGLVAGDVLAFWLQVRDVRAPDPNRRNSPKLKITITQPATEEQVEEQLKQDEERIKEQIKEAKDRKDQPPKEDGQKGDGESQPQAAQGEGGDGGEGEGSESQSTESGDGEGEKRPEFGKDGENGDSDSNLPSDSQPEGSKQNGNVARDGSEDDAALQEVLDNYRDEVEKEQQKKKEGNIPDKDQPEDNKSEKGDQKKPSDSGQQPDAGQESNQNNSEKDGEQKQPGDDSEKGNQESNRNGDPSGGNSGGQEGDPNGGQQGQPEDTQKSGPQSDSKNGGDPSTPDSGQQNADQGPTPDDAKEQSSSKPGAEKTRERAATGEEKETAEGAQEKDPNAKPAGQDVKREGPEGAKDRRQPKEGDQPQDSRSEQGPAPDDAQKAEGSKTPASDSGEKSEDGSQAGDPNGPKQEGMKPQDGSKPNGQQRPEETPSGADEPPGEGRKDGQKSDQPQAGEKGGSQQAEDGNTGETSEGGQDSQSKPGEDAASKSKTGSEKSTGGEGQEGKEGEEKSGGEGDSSSKANGEKGDSEKNADGKGQEGGKGDQTSKPSDGEGSASEKGSKDGGESSPSQGSAPAGAGNDSPRKGGNNSSGTQNGKAGSGEGDGAGGDGNGDAANLDYAKEATDLVLKKLGDDLERGEVDQELLERLGWGEDDLRKFTERMQEKLSATETPEVTENPAQVREFEEMLKSLDVSGKRQVVRDRTGPNRAIDGSAGRRAPPPAEYRDAFEAFTRSLAEQQQQRSGD